MIHSTSPLQMRTPALSLVNGSDHGHRVSLFNFRRIRRIGSGLGALAEDEFDPSRFNETSVLKQDPVSTRIYRGVDDGFRIIMKSIYLLKDIDIERLQQEIDNLVNLRYAYIVYLIGFVHPSQSQSQLWGFEIVRLYCWGGSLSEVFEFHQSAGLQQLKRKQLLDLCLSCGLRTA
jgi:hypothetical protein